MNKLAITTKNASKLFKVYGRPIDMLREFITGKPQHQDFAALDSVSFDVKRGEVVGLIGRNGAGKSTLLKIIAGTLEASSGEVEVHGRVSAILELGTGFNPEYTGRENIYLGGLCLGLSRKEVREREADIIAFSELEEFIDRPLKTYSSGMQARLTFSVATSVEPDILIVDEALSVGDAKFQRKCFRRFEEFRQRGQTILFVTHAAHLVEQICDRAVYLEHGKIKLIGLPKAVVDVYHRDLFGPVENSAPPGPVADNQPAQLRYGTGDVAIVAVDLLDANGVSTNVLRTGEGCSIRCTVRCWRQSVDDLNIGVSITTKEGVRLFAVSPPLAKQDTPLLRQEETLIVHVSLTMNLGLGDYFITCGAWGHFEEHHYDRRVDVLHFQVIGDLLYSQSLVNCAPHYEMTILKEDEVGHA